MALASLNVPQKVDTPLRLSLSVSLAGAARPGASRLFLLCVGIAMPHSCPPPPWSVPLLLLRAVGRQSQLGHGPAAALSLSFSLSLFHRSGFTCPREGSVGIEECGEELGADGSRARVGESGSATSMGCGWRSSDAELDSWRAAEVTCWEWGGVEEVEDGCDPVWGIHGAVDGSYDSEDGFGRKPGSVGEEGDGMAVRMALVLVKFSAATAANSSAAGSEQLHTKAASQASGAQQWAVYRFWGPY